MKPALLAARTGDVSAETNGSVEIVREAVCRRLSAALACGVTILRAPPGYGKSTALRQSTTIWQASGAKTHWLDQASGGLASRLAPFFTTATTTPHVIVLDQMHVSPPGDWEPVTELIRARRAGIHLVLATRHDPPPETLRVCEQGGHQTVGTADLRFSASECRSILAATWSPERMLAQGEDLYALTAGWPAAVASVATISELRSEGRSRRGRWREYVRAQSLDAESDDVQRFLRGSVFLGAIRHDLCDAVFGRRNSAAVIEALAARELVSPIAGESGWFRHHPLLAETLREVLLEDDPTEGKIVHRLAARWHAEQGDKRRTLGHLLALGEYAAAAKVVLGTASAPEAADAGPLRAALADFAPTSSFPDSPILSPRELEVLRLLAAGLSNKSIAKQLFVSVGTVKSHLYKIFRKLNVGNRTSAIGHARRIGLID